jgi:hypothetical protein
MTTIPQGPGAAPDLAFAVATRGSPLRLRWLFNAVEELSGDAEVVVAARSTEADVFRWAAEHPLGAAGRLRAVPASSGAAVGELWETAWRASSAPVVAFVEPDMRPREGFVAAAVEAISGGRVVEAAVEPDPLDASLMASPLHHAPRAAGPWPAGTVWPREVLEEVARPAPVASPGLVLYAAVRPFGRPAAAWRRVSGALRGGWT